MRRSIFWYLTVPTRRLESFFVPWSLELLVLTGDCCDCIAMPWAASMQQRKPGGPGPEGQTFKSLLYGLYKGDRRHHIPGQRYRIECCTRVRAQVPSPAHQMTLPSLRSLPSPLLYPKLGSFCSCGTTLHYTTRHDTRCSQCALSSHPPSRNRQGQLHCDWLGAGTLQPSAF